MNKHILVVFAALFLSLIQVHAQSKPFPANVTYAYGLMATNRNGSDAQSAYNTWKTNFVTACSNGRYRVKFDDPSQTVSEGIGYGMLLSAYAADKTLFDGLWLYYKDNRNSNGVMNWKIGGCSGTAGANGATDADEDAAMALIVAHNQWGSSGSINYQSDAKTLIAAIKAHEVESGSNVVKAGDMFGGSNLTNPSYFAPGYYRTFGSFTNDASFWNGVASTTYSVISNNLSAHSAAGGLVSDWCTSSGAYSSSASGYFNGGQRYHYDACRTPWRIAVDYAWYGTSSAKSYIQKCSDFVRVNLGGSKNIKDGYYQNGSAYGQWHNSAFVGAFAAAAMGGGDQTHLNNSYSDLVSINDASSYFNQTLKTLYLFLQTGNFYLPGGTTNPGNNAPSVSLTNPANNASFTAPATITINANASDSDGSVSKVDFYNGSTLLFSDNSSPYSYAWSNVSAGTYTLTAKATDNAGAVTTSSAVTVTVTTSNNNQSPQVSITSPANNASFTAPATITVNANASDNDGSISKVDFYNGSNLLFSDNTSPYTYTWNNVSAGTYTLTAKATDNAGAVTTSSAVTVTVTTSNNNQSPQVSITSPANNASFAAASNITISTSATDADGKVTKVEFYNGNTLLGSSTTAPFSFTWKKVSAGTYTLTAKATDNSGATTTSAPVAITVGTTSNRAPSVSLTAPSNNASYTAPASITISANASDADGSISKVDFYNGSTLLFSDNSSPYSYTWSNVQAGAYSISARATDNAGATTSAATVNVTVTSGPNGKVNLALYRPATASSLENSNYPASAAVDGNYGTRWSSQFYDPQWIYVNLGGVYNISEVKLSWEAAYGKDYKIQLSNDAVNWSDLKTVSGNTALTNDWTGLSGSGQYVRIYGTSRGTPYGYSLYEIEVYGTASAAAAPMMSAAAASAYPNPASDALTIPVHADNAGTASVTITDLSFTTVFSATYPVQQGNNEILLNVSELASGTYILNLTAPGTHSTKRINISK